LRYTLANTKDDPMTDTLTIRGNHDAIGRILTLIQKNTKSDVEIIQSPRTINEKAFGILKGRIKDPVAWQREIRRESDRDIYGD